jgi:hypothetical protein
MKKELNIYFKKKQAILQFWFYFIFRIRLKLIWVDKKIINWFFILFVKINNYFFFQLLLEYFFINLI